MTGPSSFRAPYLAIAPGRVNLLGEHVDYNGGAVLPAAIDLAARLAFEPRSDRLVYLQALDLKDEVTFSLDELDAKRDSEGQPLPAWALYPADVAWALQRHGYLASGLNGALTSKVPIGSGLSSSAAIEVAFAAAWRTLGNWTFDNLELAKICLEGERLYVGVNCGLMDQFASASGVENHALYFDTRSLEWQPVPLPPGIMIVVADSGVRRSLVTSAYNERRSACEEALSLLQSRMPGIHYLRDVSPAEFERYAGLLPEEPRKRARHVIEECDRVERALPLLQKGDLDGFGRLMDAGHASLRDLYEVSCPELDALVEIAHKLPGCHGARLTGAGFGGCTVNLVDENQAEFFAKTLKQQYRQRTGKDAQTYLTHASQGVTVVRA